GRITGYPCRSTNPQIEIGGKELEREDCSSPMSSRSSYIGAHY
ncbi:hypothetical protein NPIL_200071, partial [Nephila pilipes]